MRKLFWVGLGVLVEMFSEPPVTEEGDATIAIKRTLQGRQIVSIVSGSAVAMAR